MDENKINSSNNESGIDISRVLNKDYLSSLGEFYKCNICKKIMINPTDCEICGHSFCNDCITKTKCPFGCEKKSLKPSSMGIKNLLNNLKFSCSNEGCKETISYLDIKTHDNNCPYQKMVCPNKDCEKQLLKKDLENHINNDCEYVMIKCSYCNNKFPRAQIAEHEKMCAMSYQSFNSSNENILNIINNQKNENGDNQYIQTLTDNIDKVMKENNLDNDLFKDNKDEEIKSDKKEINDFIQKQNIVFQNESVENNLSLRQSLAQIEEDDLIDILKKAIEEKLNERMANFDQNFNKIIKDIQTIKTFVAQENKEEENNQPKQDLNDIKLYIKEIIEKAEKEVINSIKTLNEEINKEINNDKNEIIQIKNKEKESKTSKIDEINKKIEQMTNKLIDNINQTNTQINTIEQKFQNDLNKLIENNNNTKTNQNNDLMTKLEAIFKTEIESSTKESNQQIIKIINDKIDTYQKDVSEAQDKKLNDISNSFNTINKDINNLSDELKSIKTNMNQISTLVSEKFTELLNLINPKIQNKINLSQKIEELKLTKNNLNNFSFKDVNDISPQKLMRLSPSVTSDTKSLVKNKTNKKSNDESFNSLAVEDDTSIKDANKEKAVKLLAELDQKISNLDQYAKSIPDLITEKISKDIKNNLLDLGKKLEDDLDSKINGMFGLKYCVECDKVDYFFGFMKCAICSKDNCMQCISICDNCKLLVCKKCCSCPVCKKSLCLKCRLKCEQCNKYCCKDCVKKDNNTSHYICNKCSQS